MLWGKAVALLLTRTPVALVTERPPASELPGRGEKTATSNLNEEQNSGALIRDIQAILGSKIAPLSANFLIEYDSCGPSPPTIEKIND